MKRILTRITRLFRREKPKPVNPLKCDPFWKIVEVDAAKGNKFARELMDWRKENPDKLS